MSYDLIFWRQDAPIAMAPTEIYEQLLEGDPPSGVMSLPVDKIAERLHLAFPSLNYDAGQTLVQTDDGSFEVYISEHYCSFVVYGETGAAQHALLEAMAEFGCPLFDPQTEERHDAEDGTALGEVPVFQELTEAQQKIVDRARAKILGEQRDPLASVKSLARRLFGPDPKAGIAKAETATVRQAIPFPLSILAWAAIDDGAIIATSRNSDVDIENNALRRYGSDWSEQWSFDVEGEPTSTVLTADSVYVTLKRSTTSAGYILRVDTDAGEVTWSRSLRRGETLCAPVCADGLVFVGGEPCVWALRAKSGRTAWSHEMDCVMSPPAVFANEGVAVVGDRGGMLVGLDLKSGEPRWSRSLPGGYLALFRFGDACWAGGIGQSLERIDPTTGESLTATKRPRESSVLEHDGRLYFKSGGSDTDAYRLGCFDADGRRIWEVGVPFKKGTILWEPTPLRVVNGWLLVRTYWGPVYTLDAQSGRMLRYFGVEDAQEFDPDTREITPVFALPDGRVMAQTKSMLLELDI